MVSSPIPSAGAIPSTAPATPADPADIEWDTGKRRGLADAIGENQKIAGESGLPVRRAADVRIGALLEEGVSGESNFSAKTRSPPVKGVSRAVDIGQVRRTQRGTREQAAGRLFLLKIRLSQPESSWRPKSSPRTRPATRAAIARSTRRIVRGGEYSASFRGAAAAGRSARN
jgi:hypothetical protein